MTQYADVAHPCSFIVDETGIQESDYHILLQNENGPCPLLAAANCLVLKGTITLPSNCVGAGLVTIDQLINILAEKILSNHETGQADHHVQEVLTIFPNLQYGMDVNPKFIAGPTGVEYTMHLNAFDLLHIELVHGWLLEPDADEYDIIGNKTYNQLVNMVIEGNDAAAQLEGLHSFSGPMSPEHEALSTKATQGSIVKDFLERTGHQLTQYGLNVLHEYLKEGQIVVFFRNNHFNTMTKHDGLLHLLVTDLGYANISTVVWEKFDVISGDTEYVNAKFVPTPSYDAGTSFAPSGEQVANNGQSQADYQLALQMSRENGPTTQATGQPQPGTASSTSYSSEMEAARQASLQEYNRANPNALLPTIVQDDRTSSASSYVASFEQGMNSLSEGVRQAGEAASSMFQPAPPVDPHPTGNSHAVGAGGVTSSSQLQQASSWGTVATGVPNQLPSQEEQDHMMAMQLQRQEENERRNQNPNHMVDQQRSQNLAVAMARKERSREQTRAARPGPPPERVATAPNSRAGKDGNCVIS